MRPFWRTGVRNIPVPPEMSEMHTMNDIVTAKGLCGLSRFDIGAPDELEGIVYLLSIFPSDASCHGARAKWWSGSGLNFLYAMLRLFGALPDRVSGSRTGGRRRDNRDVEFVPGDVE